MGRLQAWITDSMRRHWRLWILFFWLCACALMIYERWNGLRWFALPDTDDNLRIMQVRAWLEGQSWFDLRQYRLDPPAGANVHWSRLVDLPIAAIMVVLRPMLGGAIAEKFAVGIAPLLPMAVAMLALGATARRLLSPTAFLLAIALLMCASSVRFMWTPLRIDHHGWQLAMLSLVVLSFAVTRPGRAGALLGTATAVSLTIGLEMLVYLALAGAITVLLWIRDPAQRARLLCYGASVAGGTALGYAAFASYDNQAPICDALSPVWLSAMIAAGALAVVLALLPLRTWPARLGAAAAGGVLLAAAFAGAWPHCLGRPEAVSPELDSLWLSKVREARPLHIDSLSTIATVAALPLAGIIGYAAMLWRLRGDREKAVRWLALALLCLAAASLLLWQKRAGPAAQLLAVPGAAALAWLLIGLAMRLPTFAVKGVVAATAFLIVSGIAPQYAAKLAPDRPRLQKVADANARCPTLPALRPVALQPKGLVLTFVDLGPRLIAVTHHDAIAGPYHRNGTAILDVMRSFRGSADQARQMIERRKVDYVLVCLNLSESTIYRAEAPKGFYVQLASGEIPDWLDPVELPENSPYRMWRVLRFRS